MKTWSLLLQVTCCLVGFLSVQPLRGQSQQVAGQTQNLPKLVACKTLYEQNFDDLDGSLTDLWWDNLKVSRLSEK